jgi:hypothetical protein
MAQLEGQVCAFGVSPFSNSKNFHVLYHRRTLLQKERKNGVVTKFKKSNRREMGFLDTTAAIKEHGDFSPMSLPCPCRPTEERCRRCEMKTMQICFYVGIWMQISRIGEQNNLSCRVIRLLEISIS